MTEAETPLVASPCIRICCLDEHDVCLGCFRTLDEIRGWQASDNALRTQVLTQCARRRKAHDEQFPGTYSPRT
ncbi:DUF1289 domain-containing protein [Uliginosibacterium sp. H3]|uniref:DUF1289 domain-containing protein n=1 Tax=Uliginosibacterium silvisoli TaxID=3114758 RepID=A0ABU6K157_9RHOO|nr:DUF1289 domain-containing protein [Uliginosibacterium sp. H3]